MLNPLAKYMHWLHTRWPAGGVEKLPECGEGGLTNVPGLRIVGDLSGIPLLKFSSETATQAVRGILAEPDFQKSAAATGVHDLLIIGGGVAGISAGIEARKAGLDFQVLEASQTFSTVANFPRGKFIFTYPTDMTPSGGLQFHAETKEALLVELDGQRREHQVEITPLRAERVERQGKLMLVHVAGKNEPLIAQRVIVCIGRSGNFRKLGVPGEDLDKVSNRLHDPREFSGKNVLVVGGGDTAIETAVALAGCGAAVTMSYRKKEFARPKPENIERLNTLRANPAAIVPIEHPKSERITSAATESMIRSTPQGSIDLRLGTEVDAIAPDSITLREADGTSATLPNDFVFPMLGREAPLDFFRRSGVRIRGEWTKRTWIGLIFSVVLCTLIYHWKKGGMLLPVNEFFKSHHWFPFNIPPLLKDLGGSFAASAADPASFTSVLIGCLGSPGFYYSLLYCLLIVVFGWQRIQRRRTPYVTRQTVTLAAIQIIPLFLLPYLLLPWAGHNGWFDHGPLQWAADQFFPIPSYGGDREYWRAFGLILAWPLFIWNVFNDQPLWGWLVLSFIQTFVIIPLIVWRWGKGAYCGWICSCGALAETLGDTQRQKMPHGPVWNRLNMIGQVFLAAAFFLLITRCISWAWPESFAGIAYDWVLKKAPVINYIYFVDLIWAGIIGVALYWHFSGRVWCRFACPLAALMHIYARFSRYRIFAEKKKCISCNVCTSVCHQGIDVMNFANKGMPMEDPECVRCSACVQQCPTGVLAFGHLNGNGIPVLDKLPASPVQIMEKNLAGKSSPQM